VGRALPVDVMERSVAALASWPTALIFLAYLPGEDGTEQVAGVASCFRGWGTFAGRQLLNVHDLAVLPHFHRRGVGKALLQAVIDRAKTEGCGKVTLEALTHNTGALALYTGLGFTSQMAFYELRL
jgi:ribosomal protein S18 acetylase RimI-like enzyme